MREGERGDAVYFIASGAVEVILPDRRIPLGSGDLFGELALLTGETRQADVVASDLLPVSGAAQGRFRPFHARQPRYTPCNPADRRVALVENKSDVTAAAS